MEFPVDLKTTSPRETEAVGSELAECFVAGDRVILEGDLGSGKTVLVRGICRGLGIAADITSPTFTLAQRYEEGRLPVSHLDLYRLEPGMAGEDPGVLEGEFSTEWYEPSRTGRKAHGYALGEYTPRDVPEIEVALRPYVIDTDEMTADDGVAAPVVRIHVDQMHRAATAAGRTRRPPKQLRHHRFRRRTLQNGIAVITVMREQVVVRVQRGHGADSNRLLAIRQVQKASDAGLRIHFGRFVFKHPN